MKITASIATVILSFFGLTSFASVCDPGFNAYNILIKQKAPLLINIYFNQGFEGTYCLSGCSFTKVPMTAVRTMTVCKPQKNRLKKGVVSVRFSAELSPLVRYTGLDESAFSNKLATLSVELDRSGWGVKVQ